jgi:large subunit ribosomal protein L33
MPQENLIKLQCSQCKRNNYFSHRNKKTVKEKIALKKYCKHCRQRTLHKETKK